MSKYYDKELPDTVNVFYGERRAGVTYREIEKLKNENKMLREKVKEIERLNNIIKEVRELLKNDYFEDGSFTNYKKVFELLDKGSE